MRTWSEVKDANKRMDARKLVYIRDTKGRKCSRCRKTFDTRRLQFHHRHGTVKLFNLGDGKRESWSAIRNEITKCDVLCKVCHDETHAPGIAERRDAVTGRWG
jgi:hypothetical protein